MLQLQYATDIGQLTRLKSLFSILCTSHRVGLFENIERFDLRRSIESPRGLLQFCKTTLLMVDVGDIKQEIERLVDIAVRNVKTFSRYSRSLTLENNTIPLSV